jgi:membrane-associated phospholipid phosphatase
VRHVRDLRRLFLGLYPIGLVGLFYGVLGLVKEVGITSERVHVCDLRALDLHLFSVRVNGAPGTAHDWVQAHPSAALYARSNDVFGAMPSLHVGYPALIVLFGWRLLGSLGRALSVLFLGSMCFAAVYLDHHWIVDVIAGLAFTVVVTRLVLFATRRVSRESAPLPAGADPR